MQIYITEAVREQAKLVAKKEGKTLNEFIMSLFARAGDKELKKLVEQELKSRPKPGRPWDK
jgi:hypothetical protein